MTPPAARTSAQRLDALAAELADAVRGEVAFDEKARALYASDASHYRQPPLGVVTPLDADDAVTAMDVCRTHEAAVLPRGAGTSLAGQGCNAAVVLDLSRHLRGVLAVDPEQRTARVEPGVVLDDLQAAAAPHGLCFGPDPATHAWCTVGGMIGNNSCGVHSIMAGRTSDNVEQLELLLPEGLRLSARPLAEPQLDARCRAGGPAGALLRGLRDLRDRHAERLRHGFPALPRRVSGYNLDALLPEHGFHLPRALTGTEGTCGLMLEATVRLVPRPAARVLLLLGYPDSPSAADAVPALLRAVAEGGLVGLEGLDHTLVENMRARRVEADGLRLLPEGGAWLLAELGGADHAEAVERARALADTAERAAPRARPRLLASAAEADSVWRARKAAVGASGRLAGAAPGAPERDTWTGWEDAAVPPERLGEYLRGFEQLTRRFGYRYTLYGHYGDGCVHTRLDFDLASSAGIARYRDFVEQAADLVADLGGSLSGEHGDGQSRAELLPRMFGDELVQAFSEFKALFDPRGRMNPGKVVRPARLDEHLRPRADRPPPRHATHFRYLRDAGSFARATARCIGVGRCRSDADDGVMCPSWKVTHEEQHGTRGRAHLLAELAEGRLERGWQSEAVHEALALCLSCKGCKRDCPAGVDVATYKAEFLAQRYARRRRPLRAYAFGWFHRWARAAAWAPGLANALANAPGVGLLARRALGITTEREPPRFARSFVRVHRRRERRRARDAQGGQRVLLWPDTFTNHLHTGVARAAVEVLRAAGFVVELPSRPLCCGRPLYDAGMLPLARRLLREVLDALEPALERDLPVVVLEPSCLSVFRDELPDLLPDDPRAARLASRALTLAQLLDAHAPDWSPPRRTGRALLHGHCHQKSVCGGTGADARWLARAGLDVHAPDPGCCGLAGSFGFEAHAYEVSVAVGERVLAPALRAEPESTLAVADGFSCREQIAHLTGRRALHLAQVLAGETASDADG